jgi:hypothetical protein
MSTVVGARGLVHDDGSGMGPFTGELIDGLRRTPVAGLLVREVRTGHPDDAHTEGVFDPVPDVLVGHAARLVLDDGRSGLVVLVSDRGRFHSVGIIC